MRRSELQKISLGLPFCVPSLSSPLGCVEALPNNQASSQSECKSKAQLILVPVNECTSTHFQLLFLFFWSISETLLNCIGLQIQRIIDTSTFPCQMLTFFLPLKSLNSCRNVSSYLHKKCFAIYLTHSQSFSQSVCLFLSSIRERNSVNHDCWIASSVFIQLECSLVSGVFSHANSLGIRANEVEEGGRSWSIVVNQVAKVPLP